MTRRNQENARKVLKDLKILEEKQKGVPKKLYYKINQKCLNDLIEGCTLLNVRYVHSSEYETYTQERADRTDSNVQSVHTINNTIIDYNKINKESVGHTRSNSLSEVQKSVGFEPMDHPDSALTADIKNKYTNLDAESKKELWNELRETIWDYARSKKWLDKNYPKRWEILELLIRDFCGYHIDKGSFDNAFFNYERKLIQWIDKDILKESALPYSIWNKTNDDLKKKTHKEGEALPDYYNESIYNSLSGAKLTEYKQKLRKKGYTYDKIKQCWYDASGKNVNGQTYKSR